jgi:hypothetical protein
VIFISGADVVSFAFVIFRFGMDRNVENDLGSGVMKIFGRNQAKQEQSEQVMNS